MRIHEWTRESCPFEKAYVPVAMPPGMLLGKRREKGLASGWRALGLPVSAKCQSRDRLARETVEGEKEG